MRSSPDELDLTVRPPWDTEGAREDGVKPSGWPSANRPLAHGGPGGRAAARANAGRNVRASGVSMTSTHDWDAESVLTLVLGLIATFALGVALVWAIFD